METMLRPFKRMRLELDSVAKPRVTKRKYETNTIEQGPKKQCLNALLFIQYYRIKNVKRRLGEGTIEENGRKRGRHDEVRIGAAIKIQKVYRGWRLRKKMRRQLFLFYTM